LGKLARTYKMLVPLVALLIFSALTSDVFLTAENLLNIGRQLTVVGVAAVGATFVIITFGIDLSAGPVIALVGVIIAVLQNLPFWLSLLVAVTVGAFCGLVNGLLIARVRLPAFIATFGMGGIAAGLALGWSGGWPLFIRIPLYGFLGNGNLGPIPVPFVIYILIVIAGHLLLTRTPFGAYTYGMGTNPEALRLAGINVRTQLVKVYMLAGFLAGVSGIIAAGRSMTGDPSVGMQLSFDVIAAVVVGGTRIEGGYGGITETLIGTVIIGVLNNIMNLLGVFSYYQMVLKGAIIIVAVLLTNLQSLLLAWERNKKLTLQA